MKYDVIYHRSLIEMTVEHCSVFGHVARRVHQLLHLLTDRHKHTHITFRDLLTVNLDL